MKVSASTKPFSLIVLLALAVSGCEQAAAAAPEMTVYTTPGCTCCEKWVEHMREHGYTVKMGDQEDLAAVRREYKIPAEMTSCHMGVVDGFAVEGHVPADVVDRLRAQKPSVLGISAPGMPAGSPGMEMPDGSVAPYEVLSWDATGPRDVFQFVN